MQRVIVVPNHRAVGSVAADLIEPELRGTFCFGTATGGSVVPIYEELVRRYQRGDIDFSQGIGFGLDEYLGLPEHHPQSYRTDMWTGLWQHVNIHSSAWFLPSAYGLEVDDLEGIDEACERYESYLRDMPIDVQLLGIGPNGHIGFNEPGSEPDSITRRVELTESTRLANSRFFDRLDDVPTHALTMGLDTICRARKIVIVANGEKKASPVKQALEGDGDVLACPAAILREHDDVTWVLDFEAAALLEATVVERCKSA